MLKMEGVVGPNEGRRMGEYEGFLIMGATACDRN